MNSVNFYACTLCVIIEHLEIVLLLLMSIFPHKVKYPKNNAMVSTEKCPKPHTELLFPALIGRYFVDILKTAYVRA